MNYRFTHLTFIITIAVLMLGGFGVAQAAFNEKINYQGKLTDSNGVAVSDGNNCMNFTLYDAVTGGSPLWDEQWTATSSYATTTSGLFSVLLGSYQSLSSVDFNQTVYLEVKYDPACDRTYEEVFAPLKEIGAVPAAFEAKRLGGYEASELNEWQTLSISALSPTSTIGIIVNASSSISKLMIDNGLRTASTTFTGIIGSTQCLQVDTDGKISGSGSACGVAIGIDEDWQTILSGTAITPTTTATVGIVVNASSSISNLFVDELTSASSTLGTVTSGSWTGSPIADAYLTKTGDWTGTLDGFEADALNDWQYLTANAITPATTTQGIIINSSSTIAANLSVGTSSDPTLFVHSGDGNVGIGTDTPDLKLELSVSGNNGMSIANTTVNGYSSIWLGNSEKSYNGALYYQGSGQGYMGNNDTLVLGPSSATTSLRFVTNSTNRMTISYDGNVGIGTTTPEHLLTIGTDGFIIDDTAHATSTQFYTSTFGINSEYFTDLTGTGLQNSSGVLTLNATGDWTGTLDGLNAAELSNWQFSGTSAITPTSTVGIILNASSSIQSLTVSGEATSTNLVITGNSTLGAVISGSWTGSPIGDAYLTKTGDWTGTLDGFEATGLNDWKTLTATGIGPTTSTAGIILNASSSISKLMIDNGLRTASTTFTGITGSTQCLQVDTDGKISGTGVACGSGSGIDEDWQTILSGTAITPTTTATVGIVVNASSSISNLFVDELTSASSTLGTVTSGSWTGSPIADAYLTKTGDWTGTLDGFEATGLNDWKTLTATGIGPTTSTAGIIVNASSSISTLYVDTLIATSTELALSSLTAGSVVFAGTGGKLWQDNSNLFWDDTNNYLGIATSTPEHALTVEGNMDIATSTLFVDSINRRVGITTSTPEYSLTIDGTFSVDGVTKFRGVEYTWPTSAGNNNDVLTSNGAGTLSWAAAAGGSDNDWTSGADLIYSSSTAQYVGISTTTPEQKLSVAGSILAEYLFTTSTEATSTIMGYLSIGDLAPDAKLDITEDRTAGIIVQASYETAKTLSGNLTGIDLDLNTNITPGSYDITGINLEIASGGTGDYTFLKFKEGATTLYDFDTVTAQFDVPASFNAAGDVSLAYDLILTNNTAGYITFNGPGYIRTNDPAGNYDLTLSAANSGEVIVSNTTTTLSDTTGEVVALTIDSETSATTTPTNGLFRVISDVNSNENTVFVIKPDGTVGIGFGGPDRRADIYDPAHAQLRITQADNSQYVEFQADATGDLTITPSGDAITVPNDNVYICTGDSCPALVTLTGYGNLQVETDLFVGGNLAVGNASSSSAKFENYTDAGATSTNIVGISGNNPVIRRVQVYIEDDPGVNATSTLCRLSFYNRDTMTEDQLITAFYFNLTYTEINQADGTETGNTTSSLDSSAGLVKYDLVRFLDGTPENQRITGNVDVATEATTTAVTGNHANDSGFVRVAEITEMFQLVDLDASNEIHAKLETFEDFEEGIEVDIVITLDIQ